MSIIAPRGLPHECRISRDDIDESGTHREAVEEFITVELLEQRHKTIITSRHSGFSSDAFKQCKLVELLPLSADQQSEMVQTRVPDEARAAALVKELSASAFKDIASNPLMLSMVRSRGRRAVPPCYKLAATSRMSGLMLAPRLLQ